MADSPKQLPAARGIEVLPPLEPLPLPFGAELSFQRIELYEHRHSSISKEEAHARIEEARSMSDQAQYRFAIPAQEETKQLAHTAVVVKYVCIAVVACVLGGLVATVVRPEAALYIWRMVAVVSAVFGGIGGIVVARLRRKPVPPPASSREP